MDRRLAAILATDMVGYSRLMEADQTGIITRQKAHRRELIDPEIKRNRGNIVKTTGDGLLVEFASVSDAVRAAIDIQFGMIKRESGSTTDNRIQYRIGINIGDVVFDDGDIFGDGVNIASRLEGLSEPGAVCVSDLVYQMIQDRIHEPFIDLGSQRVKNISRPIRVWQWSADAAGTEVELAEQAVNQRVQFCIAPDGVQLAFARIGDGQPLVKAPNWMNHIEYEWRSPVWEPFLSSLAKNRKLIRFDQRGGGLSDWEVDDISIEAMISDMRTVVKAAKLERFPLFGISQGCSFSIRYAVEHPEQVKCLILLGGYARGTLRRNKPDQEKMFEALQTMMLQGWGSTNPMYRHFFTSLLIPEATPDQQAGLDELQRVCVADKNVARISTMNANVDVTDLAKRVTVPTIVFHCDGDKMVPLEEGRRMAALIPDARFVPLEGSNHILIEGTKAFDTFFQELNAFLALHGI